MQSKFVPSHKTANLIDWGHNEIVKLKTLGTSNYTEKDFELIEEALQNINSYSKLLGDVLYSGIDTEYKD